MRDFILRARKGPSTPDFSSDDLPSAGHLEIVCHCIANALFYSLQLRDDVRVHIALDGPAAPPKVVRIESEGLGSLDGFDERALAAVLSRALADGRGLDLDEEVQSRPGVFIAKRSFESLVRQQSESGDVYCCKSAALTCAKWRLPSVRLLSFQTIYPCLKKRISFSCGSARALSVGPKMLFASQCITLVHNELDRQNRP